MAEIVNMETGKDGKHALVEGMGDGRVSVWKRPARQEKSAEEKDWLKGMNDE